MVRRGAGGSVVVHVSLTTVTRVRYIRFVHIDIYIGYIYIYIDYIIFIYIDFIIIQIHIS